jgi:hypothetical protein
MVHRLATLASVHQRRTMGGKVASLEIAAEHKHWDRRSQLREIEAPCVIDRPDPPITARLATHPACRIAYVRLVDPFRGDVLARGYASLTSWLEVRGIEWRQRPLFGMSWDHYDTTPIHRVRFDLGFGVTSVCRRPTRSASSSFPPCGPSMHTAAAHCDASRRHGTTSTLIFGSVSVMRRLPGEARREANRRCKQKHKRLEGVRPAPSPGRDSAPASRLVRVADRGESRS